MAADRPVSPAPVSAAVAQHPVTEKLTLGMLAGGWAPFDQLVNGKPAGLSIDYLRLTLSGQVSLEVKTFPDMPAVLKAACDGTVDIVPSVARTPEREQCLTFTAPYFHGATAVVTRASESAVFDATRLRSARIAVEQGFSLERQLSERYPRAQRVVRQDTFAALQAVADGDADAYFGFAPAIRQQLAAGRFNTLHVAFEETSRMDDLRFAMSRDNKALRNRIDAALARLRPVDEGAIRARWIGATIDARDGDPGEGLELSERERAYLRALPVITIGFDASWAPFSYVDQAGRPSGIASDYLDYLSRTLGVSFRRSPDAGWAAALESFQRGSVALLATATAGDPRLPGAQITDAYESYPIVIAARRDEPPAQSLADFAHRRIVVTGHLADPARFSRAVPQAAVIVAPTVEAALRKVAEGEADAFVDNVATIDAAIQDQYAGVLKIVGAVGETDPIAFALGPDLKPLAGLIGRALRAMPQAEKLRIRQKWQGGAAQEHAARITSLRLLPLLIGVAVALFVTLRAYVLLQREVRRREDTERQLESQLNFQQTMMEMVPYPLVAKDHENRYIAVNRAFELTLGVRREDVLGRTGAEARAWGRQHSETLDRLTAETLRMGALRSIELDFTNRAGDLRHGLFWVGACAGIDGGGPGVICTMVDITEIRRAERRARETERRLFDVTRSLPAVVFQLRRDPNGVYSLPYVGGDTLHLLGNDDTALFEDGAFTLISEEDRAQVRDELERSAVTGEPILVEFRRRGEGAARWVRAELVPRREANGSVVWSGYWADASVERARTDELAHARDLAQAASKAKDDFLAMMSHEIRTPMNGVLGLVEVLETTQLDVDQQQMLGMIHDSAGALLQILDDLLDYSKIEAGALTIAAEPIDMRELVDGAVGLLAGRAHEKGLRMRVDVEPEVAATLRGDSVRLRQILFNLLSNAIKFTLTGEVSVHVAVVTQTEEGQSIDMSVEDTGIGIAPEVQARLFAPFVQAESSTTRRFGGTGLGLAICRRLIDLMGGTLSLNSTPGAGTKMRMRLVMPVEQQNYAAGRLRGKRGIVAIDDFRVARALVHFGQALGMDLRRISPGSADLDDPAKTADVDLIFVRDDFDVQRLGRSKPRIIHVTEKKKPTGYRVLENDIRVSVNPISWHGLSAACVAALSDTAQPAAKGSPLDDRNAPPDRDSAIANGRLVLVAEDHPVNQELIRHQLELLGFACDVVEDGAEALSALEHRHYGFLITDCHMPNVSGYELAKQVRARESRLCDGIRLPILGVTASTAPEELRLCREAGMDDCLVKPTRLATLRDHLDRWFGPDADRHGGAAEAQASLVPQTPADGAGAFGPDDLAYMRQLWGNESTVKALLDSFVASLRDDLRKLPALFESGDLAKLRHWHHRVAGATSVLRYQPLLDVLDVYRRDMAAQSRDELCAAGYRLIETCSVILDRIEEQASRLA
ncbi:transporter substrate-binding domain-containing protein [Trinickia terrae]|uniref:Virulence sensor protein BvgS n=1 Tax=Trinickia terrae TaxID=2571161 RepID=A0A4U1I872_9BURK|nr:transporter substrate-binding domain-containing protein [Trinickia terrae]TKC89632.1 transporter substrate-binding domain-containing protein [Trinickia terrae]